MDQGFGIGVTAAQVAVIVLVALGVLYAILFATAALGLGGFTMFERFRSKREEPEDDGIDGLF